MSAHLYHKTWNVPYPKAVRASGVYIYDDEGRRYLDAVGGSYVVSIGHGVPEIGDAMAAQAKSLAFPYVGTFTTDAEIALGAAVIEMAPPGMQRAYFVSGGSEAFEVAIKFARKYQLIKGNQQRWRVAGRWQSYHGATIAALSASGHTGRRAQFQPYLLDFPHIDPPYCFRCPWESRYPGCGLLCAEDLERMITQVGSDTIAAFVCETITGASSGAVVPPAEYYPRIREICDEHDILFIADEVITGFGRTGANFALDHYGVTPDLMICGKGLSSGYAPLGAIVMSQKVAEAFDAADNSGLFTGYTYSGHPVSCAAGVAVLEYMKRHQLVERARVEGDWFHGQLQQRLRHHACIGDIRGRGLLVGIEFVADSADRSLYPATARFAERVVRLAWERGVILRSERGTIDGVRGEHLLLAPPLIISRPELTEVIDVLDYALPAAAREVEQSLAVGADGAAGGL
jgi:adenosylmethionine-8-amino-7-oxononanoate aminotransferase